MILIPWGLFLLMGFVTGELYYKLMIILADASLIMLAYYSTKPLTKSRIIIEAVVFGILLLPFIVLFTEWPLSTFNYLEFTVPFSIFIVMYTVSVFRSIKAYRRSVSKAA